MIITGEVRGLREVDRVLAELGPRVARRLAGNAVRAGGRVIRRKAVEKVPKRTRKLARAIIVRGGKDAGTAVVGARRPTSNITHLVEFGTKGHRIGPKRGGKVLRLADGRFVRSARHPGARARPFLGPALEGGQAEAVRKIADNLIAGIAREVVKIRGSRS